MFPVEAPAPDNLNPEEAALAIDEALSVFPPDDGCLS